MPIQVSKVGDKMMCPTPLWVGVLRPGGKALSESSQQGSGGEGPAARGSLAVPPAGLPILVLHDS